MTFYSFIRRKFTSKSVPFVKRVILPASAIFFLFHLLSGPSQPTLHEEENLIIPGEALDPIAKKHFSGHPKEMNVLEKPKMEKISFVEHKNEKLQKEPSKVESIRENSGIEMPPLDKPSKNPQSTASNKFSNQDIPQRLQTDWSMAKANIPDAHKVKFRGHAITNDTVTLTLMSSADKIFMSINKREIYRSLDQRGLHVVVLNQYSGRVMAKRVFDTFSRGVEEDLVEFIDDITDGRIIVFIVLDEIATGLTWKGRNKLRELGSRFSEKIAYRDMWAMATRQGGLKIAETYSNVATADTGYAWGGPIFMRTDFDLEEKPVECEWPYNERNQARRLFCVRYEGYGPLCRCDVTNWQNIFFKTDKKLHKELSANQAYVDLAVVILATNRPHSLFKILKSLFEAPGLNSEKVVIYIEKSTREVTALAKLFGVSLVESGSHANISISAKIRHKVQRVFRDVLSSSFSSDSIPEPGFPKDFLPPVKASKILLLEEDMQVSIDIFKYLHALTSTLEKDKTVMAVSAFNHNGFREVIFDQTTFYRTSDPHGVALMLTANTVNSILAKFWPKLKTDDEWYEGLTETARKHQMDIVYPEIPRIKHSSYDGHIIKGAIQEDWFKDHMISMTTEYDIPSSAIESLDVSKYEANVKNRIQNGNHIVFDFCENELIYGKEPHVMFIANTDNEDKHLRYVLKCLKTWSIYPTGGWRGVWQFHFHGHPLMLVGVPSSQYSYLVTSDFTPVTAPPSFNATDLSRKV